MRSMTGFGVGHAPCPRGRVVVEARSVNHRFLDVRVRMPAEMGEGTFSVEQQVRARCERGRYDLAIRFEVTAADAPLDMNRARRVYGALSALRDELAPGSPLPISAVLGVPGVFGSWTDPEAGASGDAIAKAVDNALDSLDSMRQTEGAALATELSARLVAVRQLVHRMRGRLPEVTQALGDRLRARIEKAVSKLQAAPDLTRLETEIALLADRADVTEEFVRLTSHFEQFDKLIGAGEKVGRRLDFLLQEMGRETNTIGAKSPDAQLSHWVVQLKAELERMREQVQNVE